MQLEVKNEEELMVLRQALYHNMHHRLRFSSAIAQKTFRTSTDRRPSKADIDDAFRRADIATDLLKRARDLATAQQEGE